MFNRVPIPRLPNRHNAPKSRRIARACDECRARKTKCDGKRPTCAQCASVGLGTCIYSESKITQERKQLESANREIDRYDALLREISQEVDASVARKIMHALRPLSQGSTPALQGQSRKASSASSSSSASSIGSLDALDTLDEDVNRSKASVATGYLGKSSEVAWIQSLARETGIYRGDKGLSPSSQNPQLPLNDSIAAVDYHIESADYSGLVDENPYALPAKAPAERLIKLYLDSVQPSLPVIRQALFIDQFNSLYSGECINPGRKWLAVLNLVFAISSKLCQISGQDIHNKDNLFFARAQKLNISESLVEDHEDLQQVQVETLAAFFLLTSSQVNRAWKMIGTATRSAIALGLHLRATHNKLNASALEARHKLWWSIFVLENLLSVMTGRSSGLGNSFCSAPPPLVSESMDNFSNDTPEDRLERPSENPPMKWTIYLRHERLKAQRASMKLLDATEGLYFFCLVDLVLISHIASTQVYSTDSVKQGWDQIQSRIDFYNRTMEDWCSSLPDSMCFSGIGRTISNTDTYLTSLSMHYYSSRIILNRPCLSRPKEGKKSGINSYRSRARTKTATTCLQSALAIVSIFPDKPDTFWACHGPWWNILHFLVQATTVLLIHISLETTPSSQQEGQTPTPGLSTSQLPDSSEATNSEAVRSAIKKALQWLYCLGKTEVSARRAFEICNTCICRIAPTDFVLDEFVPISAELKVRSLAVPTDEFHQQHRCKDDVPYPQFAGTKDFGYDRSTGIDAQFPDLGATEEFDLPQQASFGNLTDEIDMPDYIPKPHESLEEMLLSLKGLDNGTI